MATDKSYLNFRCPNDLIEAIDSIGKERYPTEVTGKTPLGYERTKTVIDLLLAGIEAVGSGSVKLSKPNVKQNPTVVKQDDLQAMEAKLISIIETRVSEALGK